MRFKGTCVAVVLAVMVIAGIPAVSAQTNETILHRFIGTSDGNFPGNLVAGPSGSYFGVTYAGGANGCGAVFLFAPPVGGGSWTESVLYSFPASSPRPSLYITFSPNIQTIYGTVFDGGATNGSVFQLTPPTQGGVPWIYKNIHDFAGGTTDGAAPSSLMALTLDPSGNLYGTTAFGGLYGNGTVFKLSPQAGGTWTQQILHHFKDVDGVMPFAGVIRDANGVLYGTTNEGGVIGGAHCPLSATYGCGVVYSLGLVNGTWTHNVLYAFKGANDGAGPLAGLVLGTDGSLYGGSQELGPTTPTGGAIFRLTPQNGTWTFTNIHSFTFGGVDGDTPNVALIRNAAGTKFFGTTLDGGLLLGCCNYGGTVFRIDVSGSSTTFTTIHTFSGGNGGSADGANGGPLVLGADGTTIYGTTTSGGGSSACGTDSFGYDIGCGTIFKLTQ